MLSATEFREEHENGFDGRPKRIQRLRHEFAVYCDLDVPRSVAAVIEWYNNRKGVITKRLNARLDGDSDGEEAN